jgi:anti-sigma-K factor RskA
MSVTDHKRYEEDIGAFLLGALSDGEHDAFERHLATCHVCQDELERLRAAADALPRSVEQYEPPQSLKIALMEQVYADAPAAATEARPRRSLADRLGLTGGWPRFAVAAATALLVVGVAVGYGISSIGNDDSGTRSVAAAVDTSRVGQARATMVVPKDADGAQLRVSGMPQTRAGQVYQVWLQRGDQVAPGPLFSVDRNGNGVGAVPGDLHGVNAVLVTRERTGGASQPTEAPVVKAKV